MGGGKTVDTSIAPELKPLVTGSAWQLGNYQNQSDLSQYGGSFPQPTAGLSSYERYGMGQIPNLQSPNAMDAYALQNILNLPAMAGQGPTTGYMNRANSPQLSQYMSLLNPYGGSDVPGSPSGDPWYQQPGTIGPTMNNSFPYPGRPNPAGPPSSGGGGGIINSNPGNPGNPFTPGNDPGLQLPGGNEGGGAGPRPKGMRPMGARGTTGATMAGGGDVAGGTYGLRPDTVAQVMNTAGVSDADKQQTLRNLALRQSQGATDFTGAADQYGTYTHGAPGYQGMVGGHSFGSYDPSGNFQGYSSGVATRPGVSATGTAVAPGASGPNAPGTRSPIVVGGARGAVGSGMGPAQQPSEGGVRAMGVRTQVGTPGGGYAGPAGQGPNYRPPSPGSNYSGSGAGPGGVGTGGSPPDPSWLRQSYSGPPGSAAQRAPMTTTGASTYDPNNSVASGGMDLYGGTRQMGASNLVPRGPVNPIGGRPSPQPVQPYQPSPTQPVQTTQPSSPGYPGPAPINNPPNPGGGAPTPGGGGGFPNPGTGASGNPVGPSNVGGPNMRAAADIGQYTNQPLQGGYSLMDSPGITAAYRTPSGASIAQDPSLKAAMDAFDQYNAPVIENQMGLAGLGRSNALANSLALAKGQAAEPEIQAALQREENAIGRGSQATESELQRRERSVNAQTAATQATLPYLLGMSQDQTNRRLGTIGQSMAAGQTQRGIENQGNQSAYQDFLRRQALSEQATMAPFGQTPSAFGSQVRSSGGAFK